jgi:hypothetical protein
MTPTTPSPTRSLHTTTATSEFPLLAKHHKLLLVALSDLNLPEPKEVQVEIVISLIGHLGEEDRKKCCFDETFLRDKISEYKSGKWQNASVVGQEDRRYDVPQLLKVESQHWLFPHISKK